jgi:hypothetical protein
MSFMVFIVTVPNYRAHYYEAKFEAFLAACVHLTNGCEGVAISNGHGKIVKGAELKKACQEGSLIF